MSCVWILLLLWLLQDNTAPKLLCAYCGVWAAGEFFSIFPSSLCLIVVSPQARATDRQLLLGTLCVVLASGVTWEVLGLDILASLKLQS